MENKKELIEKAQKLGIDTLDLTKSQLKEAIDNVSPPPVDMPEASEGITTSKISAKTASKLEATARPSEIVKIRQGRDKKKSSSEYPKHLSRGVMQPNPHGLSTGG